MAKLERAFGLFLSERIEWATARIDVENRRIVDDVAHGVLIDLPPSGTPFRIEQALKAGLERLQTERPTIFEETQHVGVSTIGLVDWVECSLNQLARKRWLPPEKGKPLVDFRNLFVLESQSGKLFKRVKHDWQVVVQNDAAARAMAEYVLGYDIENRPYSLLYLLLDEGVNGALVAHNGFPIMEGNPELGHARPPLYKGDAKLPRSMLGCPKHTDCYEALASNGRFRRQYRQDIWELDEDHPAWNAAAYYLASLAMTGAVFMRPSEVIVGGRIARCPQGRRLIDKARRGFVELNAGYNDAFNAAYANKFIRASQYGESIGYLSALTMACLTYNPASKEPPPSIATVAPRHRGDVMTWGKR